MRWEEAESTRVDGMETQLLELGEMVCARHLIPAGFDSVPLYGACPTPCAPASTGATLVRGRLAYRFSDGDEQEFSAGDAFHLRPGHLAEVREDAELIEFTAADEYRRKAAHLARGGGG